MMIFGPLVAARTSTVTLALPSFLASEVTVSPSTTRTTGRVTDSPTPVVTLSISMTSPTATFCCLAPARTIAYTAVSFVGPVALGCTFGGLERLLTRRRTERACLRTPKINTTDRGDALQNPSRRGPRRGSSLARALLLDRDVLDVRLVVQGRPVDGRARLHRA